MQPFETAEAVAYAALLSGSFHRETGQTLPDDPRGLWLHPQPLVSHGTGADPIFRYANAAALTLWQMDWQQFTQTPSRLSAEIDPVIQSDRAAFLAAAMAQGHIADYQGIRISATGQRFRISQTLLWTVKDALGKTHGQAALIGETTLLNP